MVVCVFSVMCSSLIYLLCVFSGAVCILCDVFLSNIFVVNSKLSDGVCILCDVLLSKI
jgi:hypothetical protein